MHFISASIWQRFIHVVSMVCIFLILTGCAGMNSGFNCPMKPGQLCSSLDEVNRMVDQGKMGRTQHPNGSDTAIESAGNTQTTPYAMDAVKADEPLRYGESIIRVWIAPFEDKSGNYHQPSTVYALLQPGHWVGNPVQATDSSD